MEQKQLGQLEENIQKEQPLLDSFYREIEKVVVGQHYLVERILIGLLANGHILIEGLPGLAKTLTVKTFAQLIQLKFSRIQFTPDMLPADLTGSPIYDQKTGTFQIKKGPIFTNILLADEINRAPAKVQSALLEAMQEKQVTLAEHSFVLSEPFLVLATQNAIEQDGTYPLPESQLDRFMLKVKVSHPNRQEETQILNRMAFTDVKIDVNKIFDPEHILYLRKLVNQIYIDPKVQNYILDLVEATRHPEKFGLSELKELIQFGVSPRATLHLTLASRAYALLRGRGYLTPQDVKDLASDVLGHRLIESFHARGRHLNPYTIIQRILDTLEMP